MKKNLVFALAALAMMVAAIVFFKERPLSYTMPNPGDSIDTSGRIEVDCADALKGKTMVALAFGQSNSANHGDAPYAPRGRVFNFYDGKCYQAADPMLGATGSGGSVWTRLGDLLTSRGDYESVVFVTIGVGGTEIKRWTSRGDLNRRIADVARQLKKKKIRITHLLWHQGESDKSRGTTKSEYKAMFGDMLGSIRKLDIDAPIYVSVATRCGGGRPGHEIQQAQRELVNPEINVFAGPDTDLIDSLDDRYDACHFSESGMEKYALEWRQAILLSGK